METSPVRTTPATARARIAPVGSLKADSAITVCASLAETRVRANRGIRIAGSVGASTAPISSAASTGSPKAIPAAVPVMAAVIITPGTTSMPSPTDTVRSSGSESPRPP